MIDKKVMFLSLVWRGGGDTNSLLAFAPGVNIIWLARPANMGEEKEHHLPIMSSNEALHHYSSLAPF